MPQSRAAALTFLCRPAVKLCDAIERPQTCSFDASAGMGSLARLRNVKSNTTPELLLVPLYFHELRKTKLTVLRTAARPRSTELLLRIRTELPRCVAAIGLADVTLDRSPLELGAYHAPVVAIPRSGKAKNVLLTLITPFPLPLTMPYNRR
jgi:hypothetical protein